MNSLRRIWASYREADGYLQTRQRATRSVSGRERWARFRDINDQAYFVMIFSCFEDRVTQLCERLVRRKQALVSWRNRRRWDDLDAGRVERLPLMQRVALLVEKGSAQYGTVDQLRRTRNAIAHAAPAPVGAMNLAFHYQQIEALWRALRP